ncbi:MAG: DUF433 domain-containing protein [Planctomycetaceae bacterium]|nr:DUF433 domain-containing protein [Planctomycetaceae bacterium]
MPVLQIDNPLIDNDLVRYDRLNLKKPGRITLNPLVMGGRPCIRGMRITVGNIVGLLAAGHSHAAILEEFPELEEEDIRASLEYASWSVEEIELPLSLTMAEVC